MGNEKMTDEKKEKLDKNPNKWTKEQKTSWALDVIKNDWNEFKKNNKFLKLFKSKKENKK